MTLDDILDRWEEAVTRGNTLSVEELCADCPELIDEVRERIEHIREFEDRDRATGLTATHVTPRRASSAGQPTMESRNAIGELTEHARGGLGVVYQGRDESLQRDVAVKFMHDSLVADLVERERFLQEAEVTSRLEHPGVVPVYGLGESADGKPFYVMRFIRGSSLDDALRAFHESAVTLTRRQREFEFRQLLSRFITVCNTIAYAHNRGVLHRDIKPSNVMLGEYGETLVVDWGLATRYERDDHARASGERSLVFNARSEDSGSTSSGGIAGTLPYMCPDQAKFFDVTEPNSGEISLDRRGDIYGLGATLYKLLTGRVPFEAETRQALVERIRKGSFIPPRAVNPEIPRALESICLKAMALEPDLRYQSAGDMAKDLDRFVADESVEAQDDTSVERLSRWLRHHRRAAMNIAVSLVVLSVVLSLVATWTARVAEDERHAKESAVTARDRWLNLAAENAADTIGREIDRRWRILEAEAKDDRLRTLLQPANADKPDWRGLQDWLAGCVTRHSKTTESDKWFTHSSWFLCKADGQQLARVPVGDSVRKYWAHRDYFHGRGTDVMPSKVHSPPEHIGQVHLSSVYQGSVTGHWKVAFTAPVYRTGVHEEFLGVLGMSVGLGAPKRELGEQQLAVLVQTKYDGFEGENSRGLILHHREIGGDVHRSGGRLPRLDASIVAQLVSRMGAASFTGSLMIDDYRDPLIQNNRWVAAFARIVVNGREDELADPGWGVVVQERIDE